MTEDERQRVRVNNSATHPSVPSPGRAWALRLSRKTPVRFRLARRGWYEGRWVRLPRWCSGRQRARPGRSLKAWRNLCPRPEFRNQSVAGEHSEPIA